MEAGRKQTVTRTKTWIWMILFFGVMAWSGISPKDRFTWVLEVFPAWIAFLVLALTRKRFPLSQLAYWLILVHACILFVGGKYTYAEVPLFDWIRDALHQGRNNYDKVGHFAQGFIPAIIVRELMIRKRAVNGPAWLFFLTSSVCLAISALYELLEWAVAVASGEGADAFLGTQGFVWDTQTDMLMALIGSLCAQILLGRIHSAQLKRMV